MGVGNPEHPIVLHDNGEFSFQKMGDKYTITFDGIHPTWMSIDRIVSAVQSWSREGICDAFLSARDIATVVREYAGENQWALVILSSL